jgi:cytochrome c553
MRLFRQCAVVGVFVSSLFHPVYADDLLTQANANANACSGCHRGGMGSGTVADSGTKAMDALNTLSAATIEEALLEFRSGEREGTVMNRLARGYTESEIAAMAKVLANQ